MEPPRHVPALVDDLVEEVVLRNPPHDPTVRRAPALGDDLGREDPHPLPAGRPRGPCPGRRGLQGLEPRRFRPRIPAQVPRAPPHGPHAWLPLLWRVSLPLRAHHLVPPALRRPGHWRPVGARRPPRPRPPQPFLVLVRTCARRTRRVGSRQRRFAGAAHATAPLTCSSWTAALLCAVAGCGHLDCAHGPFRVVFVGTNNVEPSVCACIYSSVQGEWSEPTFGHHRSSEDLMANGPGAFVGNAFYFLFQLATGIVKYDLDTGEVSVIDLDLRFYKRKLIALTAAEEGQLGLASITYGSRLVVWTREACSNRDFAWIQDWVQTRVVELKGLLPAEAFMKSPKVVALADGVGVVILRTHNGDLFTVDIKSNHARKIGNGLTNHDVIAYMNFHTPGSFCCLQSSRRSRSRACFAASIQLLPIGDFD